MTNIAIGELLDFVFLHQFISQFGWRAIRLPGRTEYLLARPHEFLRRAMALQAPLHVQGILAPRQRHVSHRAMAAYTADTFLQVNAVIEIYKIGKVVDADPFNRLVVAIARAYRLQHRARGMNLRMAGHARFGGRNTGEIALFH